MHTMASQKTLDALKKKQEKIEARIKNLEKRKRKEAKEKDKRIKMLVGTHVLARLSKEEKANLFEEMGKYLKKNVDRALLGLPEKPKQKKLV